MNKVKDNRPKVVTKACNLMYLSLVIAFLNSFTLTKKITLHSTLVMLIVVVILAIPIFFIGRKNNILRIVITIIIVLGTPMSIVNNVKYFNENPIGHLLSFIGMCLELFALILLFTKQSNNWFKNK
jgi:hypothetical protein